MSACPALSGRSGQGPAWAPWTLVGVFPSFSNTPGHLVRFGVSGPVEAPGEAVTKDTRLLLGTPLLCWVRELTSPRITVRGRGAHPLTESGKGQLSVPQAQASALPRNCMVAENPLLDPATPGRGGSRGGPVSGDTFWLSRLDGGAITGGQWVQPRDAVNVVPRAGQPHRRRCCSPSCQERRLLSSCH